LLLFFVIYTHTHTQAHTDEQDSQLWVKCSSCHKVPFT